MRKTLILIIIFLVLFSATAMAASMLDIKDVRVEVDDDRQSANEAGGTIDITPDSKLTMRIEIENLYDNSVEGAEIEDIEVRAVLEEIDDGDDFEEEADEFDLRPGRDKTVTINFDIPLKLYTDETFKMTLTVEGEDKNGTRHTGELEFDVDVKKENHELRFLKKELLPSKVSCSSSTQIRLEFINTGEDDEDVELTVTSSALEYSETREFELVEDIDDDENEYTFSDTISLNDVDPGTYTFTVRAEYHDGKDTLDGVLTLEVGSCGTTTTTTTTPTTTTPTTTTPTTTTPTTTTQTTTTTTAPATTTTPQVEVVSSPSPSYVRPSQVVATPKTSYTSNSWWDDNKWLIIILVTDLVLVIAGIIVIMAVLKRRR